MVIGFYETKRQSLHYTSQLLKYLLRRQGIEYLSSTKDDISKADEIWVSVYNWIDFNPSTPLRDFDVRRRILVDPEKISRWFKSKNYRCGVLLPARVAHATWRTVMQRARTREEVEFVYSLRNIKENEQMIKEIEKHYPHLLGDKLKFRGSQVGLEYAEAFVVKHFIV